MSDIAISVSSISKCYRIFENERSRLMHAVYPARTKGMDEIWALKDINFEIKRGEAVAIIGRNGGGKSTLLEILTGTLTPTTGSIKVNGRASALLELGSGFNPEYSGRDNVILNGLLMGLTKDEILGRFAEIEAFAEIGTAIDHTVKTYSSGMMMRLAFAVQVVCDPDILIIDEALSVGDFFFQQKCLGYIRNLCSRGVTILFVSHDMGMVQNLCGRGIFLQEGRIIFDGKQTEAVRIYFNSYQEKVANSVKAVNNAETTFQPIKTLLNLVDPIWINSETLLDKKLKFKAKLIAVALTNELGEALNSVEMGSNVVFKVHYRVFVDEPIHVHFVIKNKYNQIVTAVGSLNLKINPPKLGVGQVAFFELTTNLSIEAGDYIFSVSLTQPDSSNRSGVIIDESPWIGPIKVVWKYDEEIPPFFGVAGMNNRASFFTNVDSQTKA
jgi:lipopolysaccharide transport system ATP-binding protein